LKFDNSYFREIKAKRDEDLLVLPTNVALFKDPGFKEFAKKYVEDEVVFFKNYVESHAKLSELGSEFSPPEGIYRCKTTSRSKAKEICGSQILLHFGRQH
jgi:L-ascorbate peroxidase